MKKKEIYSAARELFALKGYEGCSLQEVADKVGLNKATLYNYYKSKEELFIFILENEISVYTNAIQQTVDDHINETVESILYQIVKAFMEHSDKHRLLLWKKTLLTAISAVDESVQQSSRQVMFEKNQQVVTTIRRLFTIKNVDIFDPKVIRFINSYYIFIQSLLDWMLLNEYRMKKNIQQIAEELWANFWSGSKLE